MAWERWKQLPDRPPAEVRLQGAVEALQESARRLAEAVRGKYA